MLTRKTFGITPFIMWFLPLSFFAYQFILRLLPSLVMPEIMAKFKIDATSYGILASAYYYGYAGFQIPCAILLDIYKPKWIIFACSLICFIGNLLFCHTVNFYVAIFSRFLIGVGSAVGFLGVSKILSIWFSPQNYAKMVGASFSIGLCGAIYGGKPTNLLIENFGWQQVSLGLSCVSLLIGILILLFLKSPQVDSPQEKYKLRLQDFKQVLNNPAIWLLGIANLLMVGPLEGFADVWGVNYLITAYNYPKSLAAELISYLFFGMLFGGPLLAYLAKKTSDSTVLIACGMLMCWTFLILFKSYNALSYSTLAFIFTFLGIICCYQVLIFSLGASLSGKSLLGVRIAFLNCINMLGGSFFHTSIGKLMDRQEGPLLLQNGIKQYNLESYQSSLSIIPICAFIGSLLIYIIKKVLISPPALNK